MKEPFVLRVKKRPVELMYVALRHLYLNQINFIHTGQTRSYDHHPDAYYRGALNYTLGKYDEEFIKTFLDLWAQVKELRATGGRIYGLDAFGIAACMFAVRATMKRVRHGHHQPWAEGLESSADRFLARLERLRKQLKRRMISETHPLDYFDKSQRWESFLCFLHNYYFFCRCSYRPRNGLYVMRSLVIDQFVRWTEKELQDRDEPVPANLRKLIRRYIGYVRRGRTNYFLPQLRHDRVLAATVFTNYVVHGVV